MPASTPRTRRTRQPRPSPLAVPAVAGNVASLVHGARSRAVDPVAASILEQVLAGAPYLNAPQYRPAVEALAVTEARLRLLDRWVEQHGLFNRRGRPWAAADYAFKMERLADNLRSSLGLTPASRARLGRNVAGTQMDMARAWSAAAGHGTDPAPTPAGHVPELAEPVPGNGEQVADSGEQVPLRPAGGVVEP